MRDALGTCKICGTPLVTPEGAVAWTVCAKCDAARNDGSSLLDIAKEHAKRAATKNETYWFKALGGEAHE